MTDGWSEWFDAQTSRPQIGMYVCLRLKRCICERCSATGEPLNLDVEGLFLGEENGFTKLAPNATIGGDSAYLVKKWRFRLTGLNVEDEQIQAEWDQVPVSGEVINT